MGGSDILSRLAQAVTTAFAGVHTRSAAQARRPLFAGAFEWERLKATSVLAASPLQHHLSALAAWWRSQNLSRQFAITGAGVVLLGMSAIGSWLSKKIEDGVTSHSAAAAALYMDAFIAPLAQDLARSDVISPDYRKKLDEIMSLREISGNVLSVKIWKKDGIIAYSNFPEIIGRRFTPTPYLKDAWNGTVSGHISDLGHDDDQRERQLGVELIEIYAPIREANSNRIIAVSEFYMRADALEQSVRKAQLQSWGVVGTTAALMLLGLYGIVRRGTRTIEQQRQALVARAEQNRELRDRIEQAYWRADRMNEQFLRRLGADLHDGPAQLLGFALMRLDDLPLDTAHIAADPKETTHEVIRSALEDAIKDIRQLSRGLILPELDTVSVNEAAALVVRAHEERTGSEVILELPPEPVEATKEVKICTYRFIQEALTNAFKHANGQGQKVVMTCDGGNLRIAVSDKGPGVDPAQTEPSANSQLGLVGIRDRVETLSGTVSMRSCPDGGTVLEVMLNVGNEPRMQEQRRG